MGRKPKPESLRWQKILHTRVSTATFRWLAEWAMKNETDQSAVVRAAIREYIKRKDVDTSDVL